MRNLNHIVDAMVNVFASECAKSWVRAPVRSIQRQQNWYLLLPYTTLRNKSKDCLARNQDNVSEWSDMSIHELLLLWSSTIQIQLSILVCTKRTSSSFHWKVACSGHDISCKNVELALHNNHLLNHSFPPSTNCRLDLLLALSFRCPSYSNIFASFIQSHDIQYSYASTLFHFCDFFFPISL